MNILVIDDNEIVARSICRVLREHSASMTSDPGVALARLRAGECFDLVLCDLKMPVMDGITVLREIEAWFEMESPMLILMTGASGPSVEQAAASLASTVAILVKPFRKSELDSTIAVLSETRARRRKAKTAPLPVLRDAF